MQVEKKKISWSYSKLKLYQECPRAFKFRYIDKIETPASKISIAGKLAHRCFNLYTEYLVKHRLKTDMSIMPQIVEYVLSSANVYEDELIKEVEILADNFTRGFVLNLDTFYGAELKLAIDEKGNEVKWKDSNAFFRGILDRIDIEDNRVLVTDYKTGWEIIKDKAQLETYAWMAKVVFPKIDTFHIEHYFVRYNTKRYGELTNEDVERAKKRIIRTIKKINNDTEFLPNPSTRCSWCPYVVKCGQLANINDLQLPTLDTKEKAIQIAGKLIIVKEAIKRIEQMLKDYCKEYGQIPLGNGLYGYCIIESQKIKNIEEFMNILWDKGENPLLYLSVDMRKTKPLLGKIQELQNIIETEKSTRFKLIKNKEG